MFPLLAPLLTLTPPTLACTPSGVAEDGIDEVDDDCDGMSHIRRELVASFDSSTMVAQDFTLTRVSVTGGEAILNPAGTFALVALKNAFPWTSGELHAVLSLPTLGSSGGCTARIVVGGAVYTQALSSGVQDVVAAPSPGDTVSALEIRCTGVGASRLDWLTLQNGPYDWAPLNDLEVTFEQTKFPGGGRMTMIRASEDGAYLFTGSDVAGLAWSADVTGGSVVEYGADWVTANGAVGQWEDAGATAVWDAYSEDGSNLYVVTGLDVDEQDTSTTLDDDDGLYQSFDLGEHWTQLSPSLGTNKDQDDCDTTKPVSSGNVLVAHAGTLYVASGEATVADGRGLWVVDSAGHEPCQPYDPATLPVAVPRADWATSGATYAALPSALAVAHPDGDTTILVGYRVLAGDGAGTTPALYQCPAVATGFSCLDGDPPLACEPVDDGDTSAALDVRDIVALPTDDDVFFVVDGGRRPAGSPGTPEACDEGESSVYALRIPTTGGYELWDTDSASAYPTWTGLDGTGAPYDYYTPGECSKSPPAYGAVGDLVPPTNGGVEAELSAAAVDPDGEYAFAFYSTLVESGDYGCVRHFRAELPSPFEEGTTLDWRPFQAWSATDDEGERARTRRDNTATGGSWLGAQLPLASWAGVAVQDAAFLPNVVSGGNDLFIAGYNLWAVPQASLGYGWDSAAADLDRVPWVLAWQGSWELSGGGASALASCIDCAETAAGEPYDIVFGAMNDLGGKQYFEEPTTTPRPPGARDCHYQSIGAGSLDVSVLPRGAEVWQIMRSQVSEYDTDGQRMVLYSPDAGASWVWDAAHINGKANFLDHATDPDTIRCQDIYEEAGDLLYDYLWYGASSVGDSFAMGATEVGHPTSILSVFSHVALLTASEACQNLDVFSADPDECTAGFGGAGLWLVQYEPGLGMTYTKVENFVTEASRNPATTEACDERHYFGMDTSTEVRLLADTELSMGIGGVLEGHFDVVVTSAGTKLDSSLAAPDRCGLRRVTWDVGAEAAATWEVIPYWKYYLPSAYDATACDLVPQYTNGLELAADGHSVLLFGGARGGAEWARGGICEVDIDLATGSYDAREVIPPDYLSFQVEDLLAHPHIADLYFAVGSQAMGCYDADPVLDCDPLGLYVIQERRRPGFAPSWGSKRLSGDELEGRQGMALAWGTGPSLSGEMADIYVTGPSGTWDGFIAW